MAMKPMITITDPSDMIPHEVVNIDDDDVSVVSDNTPTNTIRKRANEETPSPSEKRAKPDPGSFSDGRAPPSFVLDSFSSWGSPRKNGVVNGTQTTNGSQSLPHRLATPSIDPSGQANRTAVEEVPNPFAKYLNAGQKFATISEIRGVIAKYSRTGVPNIVNDQVHNELCMLSVTSWEMPLEMMIDITLKMLREQADAILFSVLSKWQQTQLFKQSQAHLSTFFNEFEQTQRAAATELYNLETYKLFTVNESAFETYSQQELRVLSRAREQRRAKAYVDKKAQQERKAFRDEKARRAAIANVLSNGGILGKDPFETELGVAAYVRGYYMTAAHRFVDSVCLSMHGKLFKDARAKIFYFLEHELGLDGGNGKCMHWI